VVNSYLAKYLSSSNGLKFISSVFTSREPIEKNSNSIVDYPKLFIEKFKPLNSPDLNGSVFHQGRTPGYPDAPSQIPACGFSAQGSSQPLASR
jgi:hypothetical protein